MSWMRAFGMACVAMALAACTWNRCSSGSPEPPEWPSSAVAIRVDQRAPWSWFPSIVTHVFFARLDDERSNSVISDEVFESNFCHGDYFYLLNAPPGRYVAVGSVYTTTPLFDPGNKTVHHRSLYEEALVRETGVVVAPGSFTFMGDFLIQSTVPWGQEWDAVQSHYFAPAREHVYNCYLGRVGRGDDDAARFASEASDHLEETGWSDILKSTSQ